MIFTGNDVINQDDLTQAPWNNLITTVALVGATAGPFGTAAYSVTVDMTGSSRSINGNNLTVANAAYNGFIWIKAGTATSVESGLLVSSFQVASATVLYGPGTPSVASSRVAVTDLSTTSWTLVRYLTNVVAASSLADFLIYPNTTVSQTEGDSIILGPQRLAPASDNAEWIFGGATMSHVIHNRRSRGM